MADKVLNRTQYAEYLGLPLRTFSYIRKNHPEQFAPSFKIGNREKWYLSTVEAYHHSQEGLPIRATDKNQEGGLPID